MNSLISVIIPIYNVEKYLKRCVDSVLNQTYNNLEIVLVDDGSPDNSGKICDDYAKSDSRIKVVHKKNGGLSSARNAGLDIATGEYVSFIDSDDWVEKDLYKVLTDIANENDVDIIISQFKSGNKDEKNDKSDIKILDLTERFESICNRKAETSVCGVLFKKGIFDKERFNENRLNEDFEFYSNISIKYDYKIAVTSYQGYYYYLREDSITHQKFKKSLIDAVYNTVDAIELAKKYNSKLERYCRIINAYQSRTALIDMPKEKRKEYSDFEKMCLNNLKNNLKLCDRSVISFKEVIFFRVYILCPIIGRFFIDLLNLKNRTENKKIK